MPQMTAIWKNASCFFDLKKACACNTGIRHTFTLQRGVDLYPDQWDQMVYVLSKDALFEPFSITIAPNGRPYLHVYVPSREEVKVMMQDGDGIQIKSLTKPSSSSQQKNTDHITYKNFASVCNTAVQNYAGLALYSDRENRTQPGMTMRFGALYSYLQYGDAVGPQQLVDNLIKAIQANPGNPKQAILDKTNKASREGEPSEAFFNEFLRILIRQELRMITKNENLSVNFILRQQEMYAMRDMLVLEPSVNLGDAERASQIMQALTWYMPLFLPLVYKASDGALDIFY
jgi:hypothetical protein